MLDLRVEVVARKMVQLRAYSANFLKVLIESKLGQHTAVFAEPDCDSVRRDLDRQAMRLPVNECSRLNLVVADD